MSKNNFICEDCGEEFFVHRYSFGIRSGLFNPQTGAKIKCSKCGSFNIKTKPKEDNDISSISVLKFNGLSDNDKREILKKRSENQSKRETDKRESINKNFNKKLRGI